MAVASPVSCIFCQITRGSSASTTLLHADDKVVAFQDIKPSALRHYLVIPVKHISTVKNLTRSTEDFSLVSHMLEVGQTLLNRDAPDSKYRYRGLKVLSSSFSFPSTYKKFLRFSNFCSVSDKRQPSAPSLSGSSFYTEDNTNRWKWMKYASLGPLGGFIEVEKLLEKIKPLPSIPSRV